MKKFAIKTKFLILAVSALLLLSFAVSSLGALRAEAVGSEFNTVNTLTMKGGASIRITDPSGIRFTSVIDSSLLDTTNGVQFSGGSELGMLIAPARCLEANFDETTNKWKTDVFEFIKTNYNKDKETVSTVFDNSQIKTENGEYVIRGVLTQIRENNYIQAYQAVAYYVAEDGSYNYSLPSDSRSINRVANSAANDTSADFTEEQKAFLTDITTVSGELIEGVKRVNITDAQSKGNVTATADTNYSVAEGKLTATAKTGGVHSKITVYFDKPVSDFTVNATGNNSFNFATALPVFSKKGEEIVTGENHPSNGGKWGVNAAGTSFKFDCPTADAGQAIYGVQVDFYLSNAGDSYTVNLIKTTECDIINFSDAQGKGNVTATADTDYSIADGKLTATAKSAKAYSKITVYFDKPVSDFTVNATGNNSFNYARVQAVFSKKGEEVVLGDNAKNSVIWVSPVLAAGTSVSFGCPTAETGKAIYGVQVEFYLPNAGDSYTINSIAANTIRTTCEDINLVASVTKGLIRNREKDGITTTTLVAVNGGKVSVTANKDTPDTGCGIYIYFEKPLSSDVIKNLKVVITVNDKTNFIDVAPVITPFETTPVVYGGESADRIIWKDCNSGTRCVFDMQKGNFGRDGVSADYVYGLYIDGRAGYTATLNYELSAYYIANEI